MNPAVIAGVGRTPAVRASSTPLIATVAAAIEAAAQDAAIPISELDGLAGYPGGSPSVHDLREVLDLRLRWYDGGSEGPAHLRSLVAALLAVNSGAADHVAVYRGVERLSGSWMAAPPGGVAEDLERLGRFGITSAVPMFALRAARICHEFGLGRHELGSVVLAARRAGALNPDALLQTAISREEYVAAPMLSSPLTKLDCDRLCSGAVAVIVSRRDDLADSSRAVRVETWSGPLRSSASLLHARRPAMWDCAADLWEASTRRPSDIGVWCLYDGFSSLAVEWMAALNVPASQGLQALLADPEALSPSGPVPLNPDGGMLAGGRLHGLNYVHEACIQLRREGAERQVRPTPEAAVVAVGGGPIAGAAILTGAA